MSDKRRKVFISFTMITQIGISMMVPVFICTALGVWLNRLFDTQVCVPVLVFIGVGAAFRNLYIITKSFYAKDMDSEHRQMQYIQELKDYRKNHPDEIIELEDKPKKRYKENKGPTRS